MEGPFTLRIAFSQTVTGFDSKDIEVQVETNCRDSGNNPLYCIPGRGTLRYPGRRRCPLGSYLRPHPDPENRRSVGQLHAGDPDTGRKCSIFRGRQVQQRGNAAWCGFLTPGATAPEPISSLGPGGESGHPIGEAELEPAVGRRRLSHCPL